jgi:metal-dependent amidase/aminoacylase/carboxypeptidase family protein
MMVHPADADLIRMDCIAVQEMYIDYHGKAAHAAAAPQEGRNALDAAVLGYMNVAALRQHIESRSPLIAWNMPFERQIWAKVAVPATSACH